MITQVITIYGTVQGVGFRPTTARLAEEIGIYGYVRNMGGFVQLVLSDEPERIDYFIDLLKKKKPHSSEIQKITRVTIETTIFNSFSILPSVKSGDEIAMIPADIAICDNCLAEFYNKDNYRYKHPFISCSDCGPRYTIMRKLPYDRDTTTMDIFPMCDICEEEYTDISGRRFHAQTISCHNCGPTPLWLSNGKNLSDDEINEDDALNKAINSIKNGQVIALKGIGGYYFVCSPFDDVAVKKIREIKVREQKPFAILFKDISDINQYCKVDEKEEVLLRSTKRPVVLLERKEKINLAEEFVDSAFGNSRYIGAFLPSFGLQYLLIDECGPLIMTSANISDLPIIYDETNMMNLMKNDKRISGMLFNMRKIIVSTDDSVCRVIDDTPQLIRRSKGYTPIPVMMVGANELSKEAQILATGGHLKSAFVLSKGGYAYPSKTFGDLDNIENESQYLEELNRMKDFFNIKPWMIICDLHPNYATTRIAKEQSSNNLLQVQHHHAHVASVMAEHGLVDPIIGISFDGTGYGEDDCIWGGEILVCEGSRYERFSHLEYIKMIGGDSSMKEAWKSAVSYKKQTEKETIGCFRIEISDIIEYANKHSTIESYCKTLGNGVIKNTEKAIENNINVIKSSSIGRLFDAVASLLGIKHFNDYEGECAIMLENAANRAMKNPKKSEVDDLALLFHMRTAAAIREQCVSIRKQKNLNKVALSGGVFQNKILMDESLKLLRESEFEVFYNSIVPPNDGGIALGQSYIGMLTLLNK